MPDNKLLKEQIKMEVLITIIQKKKECLNELIKMQRKIEENTKFYNTIDQYEKLLNGKITDENDIEEVINLICNNESSTSAVSLVFALICSEYNLSERIMDKIVQKFIDNNNALLIKNILEVCDNLPEIYKDKLNGYLVANKLSEKLVHEKLSF